MRSAINRLLEDNAVVQGLSPGFYFQRCLAIFRPDLRRTIDKKAQALQPLQGWPGASEGPVCGDVALHRAVLERQAAVFKRLCADGDGISLRLRNLTPFVTGIGQAHPLENGFAFLKPYGVPYLAGSGVKGAVRAACAELWADAVGPDETGNRLEHYFGSRDSEARGDSPDHRRGALIFFDLLPRFDGATADGCWAGAMRVDLVNPHFAPYYQGRDVPADWHAPVPSYFITLREGLEWDFRAVYAPSPAARRPQWRDDVGPAVLAVLTSRGLGAKKSSAYGLFEVLDEAAAAPAVAATAPEQSAEPPEARRTAAAGALTRFIAGVKAHEVRGVIDRIRRELALCSPDEQVEIRRLLEARLTEQGMRLREIKQLVERIFPKAPQP